MYYLKYKQQILLCLWDFSNFNDHIFLLYPHFHNQIHISPWSSQSLSQSPFSVTITFTFTFTITFMFFILYLHNCRHNHLHSLLHQHHDHNLKLSGKICSFLYGWSTMWTAECDCLTNTYCHCLNICLACLFNGATLSVVRKQDGDPNQRFHGIAVE